MTKKLKPISPGEILREEINRETELGLVGQRDSVPGAQPRVVDEGEVGACQLAVDRSRDADIRDALEEHRICRAQVEVDPVARSKPPAERNRRVGAREVRDAVAVRVRRAQQPVQRAALPQIERQDLDRLLLARRGALDAGREARPARRSWRLVRGSIGQHDRLRAGWGERLGRARPAGEQPRPEPVGEQVLGGDDPVARSRIRQVVSVKKNVEYGFTYEYRNGCAHAFLVHVGLPGQQSKPNPIALARNHPGSIFLPTAELSITTLTDKLEVIFETCTPDRDLAESGNAKHPAGPVSADIDNVILVEKCTPRLPLSSTNTRLASDSNRPLGPGFHPHS